MTDPEKLAVALRTIPHRGHGAKIDEALRAIEAKGFVPANLRQTELVRRICAELKLRGYDEAKGEIPSRYAVARRLKRIGSSPAGRPLQTLRDQPSS